MSKADAIPSSVTKATSESGRAWMAFNCASLNLADEGKLTRDRGADAHANTNQQNH